MSTPDPTSSGQDELRTLIWNRLEFVRMNPDARETDLERYTNDIMKAVAHHTQEAVDKVLDGLPFEHPENGWCAKTNGQHPAKYKKCARCIVEDALASTNQPKLNQGESDEQRD